MKTKKPASAKPSAKAADVQAAKVAAFSASQKAKVTRKVASLAKGRYKVAKKTYKITRKEARRAAKEARRARKQLEACLALAARQIKKKSPAPKTVKKIAKRPIRRKVISKKSVRKRKAPVIKYVSSPVTTAAPVPPPAGFPTRRSRP